MPGCEGAMKLIFCDERALRQGADADDADADFGKLSAGRGGFIRRQECRECIGQLEGIQRGGSGALGDGDFLGLLDERG
jgi:hypothetical protein